MNLPHPLVFRRLWSSRRGLFLTSTFGLLLAGTTVAQELEGWNLVWADEFAQAEGSAPNPLYWNYNIGTGSNGWGNAELQYYTSRPENVRIEEGELVIEVRKEDYLGSQYTSTRMLTQNKLDWTYGRFEARVKVPAGTGLWPAFWMLGADIGSVGWPQCGEIDIMEFVGRQPNEIFGTIHGPGYSGGSAFGNIYDFGRPVPDDYHVYAVEWEPNRLRWYVDGVLYHTAAPADVAPNSWVFDHPHFIILNVAVGGNFGGGVSSRLEFPVRMQVDYVRVYESEHGIEPIVHDVPGRIELEEYTTHYGVRTEATTDVGGGLNLGYLTDGDWAEYALDVPFGGTYAIDLRYASPNGTAGVTLSTDLSGPDFGNLLSVSGLSATGGWQEWATARLGEVLLPSGAFTLRVTADVPGADDINLNWIELTAIDLPTWAGYPVDENGWADTGSFIGWIFTGSAPWVWSLSLETWMYLPESNVKETGAWTFVVPSMQP